MIERKKIILLTVLLLHFYSGWATHSTGLDLTYRCLGGDTFFVQLAFYRDCDGINAPGFGGERLPVIDIFSNSCGQSFTQELDIISWEEAGAVCTSLQTTCSGGTYPGVEEYIYGDTIVLPSACVDWTFSYGLCCRNNAISTINPTNVDIYVEATLDNVTSSCNSSPVFSNTPVPFICVGSSYCFNNGAIDADGDSLAYKLVTPTTGPNAGDTVNYIDAYSATNPITSTPALSLDAVTGDICMTPSMLEVTVMQVQIEEWRNGVMIGTVERDIQVRVIDCIVPNTLPEVNGIDGTGIFTASICAGDTFSFYTESIDPDLTQNVTMTWNAGIADATFDTIGGRLPTGNFSWLPDSMDISATPHCFTVTVVDDNCPFLGSQVFSFCITVTGYLATDVTVQGTSCAGDCDGQATVSVTSGTAPYDYLWDDPMAQAVPTATNLCAGTYNIQVTDSLGCVAARTVTVTAPDTLRLTLDSTAITCNGLTDGTATATVSGGTGTYDYLWNSVPPQMGAVASGLSAGNYTVIVTDDNGCDTSGTVTIIEPALLSASIINAMNVTCNGASNGAAEITVAGGTSPYNYLWDVAAGSSTDSVVSGLSGGFYEAQITDASGCVDSVELTIVEPNVLDVVIGNSVDVSCLNGLDGSATASVSGGTSPYDFLWDAGAGNQTDSIANGLVAGTYQVVVTDSNNCMDSVSVTIAEPASAISLNVATTPVRCFQDSNGIAVVTPSGGTAPYTYLWDTLAFSQTDSMLTNLPKGTYGVTVFDLNGCVYEPNIVIDEPQALTVGTSATNVDCFAENTGTATVMVSGGTTPYNYLWDVPAGGQTDSTAINLMAGSYQVVVTDTNGCVIDTTVTISQPAAAMAIAVTEQDLNCFGDTNGLAAITITGATPPYSILWEMAAGGGADTFVTNLVAGDYQVVVTDSLGCQDSVVAAIQQPLQPLSLDSLVTPVRCFGDTNGIITAIASGGTSPYSYLWQNNIANSSDSIAIDLVAGNYALTVVDTNGCVDSMEVLVSQPNLLMMSMSVPDTICPGDSTTVGVTVMGGNGGNSYTWNQGLSDAASHVVNPGLTTSYEVFVTDSLGCTTTTDSTTVSIYYLELSGLILSSSGDVCIGDSTTISGSYSGGIGDYTVSWNEGLGTSLGDFMVAPSDSTDYILTVTDQCSNSIADTVRVRVFPYPLIDLLPTFVEGCLPYTVNFLDSLNDTTAVSYVWNFGDGNTSTEANPTYTYQEDGTYNATVTVTSNAGCVSASSISSTVNVFPKPSAFFTANPGRLDTQDPTVTLNNESEGNNSNFWLLGNGDSSEVVSPVYTYADTGTYTITLTVMNEHGCLDTFDLQITVDPYYSFNTPNVFTPNPNGGNGGAYDPTALNNDIFYPFTDYVEEYQLLIFNRWGELIFESNDLAIGWDGYYRSEMCQQDTYVWKVNLTYTDGQKVSKVGDITLLR